MHCYPHLFPQNPGSMGQLRTLIQCLQDKALFLQRFNGMPFVLDLLVLLDQQDRQCYEKSCICS